MELAAPEVVLFGEDGSLQPVTLPDGIVGVLNGQWRQRIAVAVKGGTVEGNKFVYQHTDGPAVSDDVMLGEQQYMLFVRQLQQLTADQRTSDKVEGRLRFKGGELGDTVVTHR